MNSHPSQDWKYWQITDHYPVKCTMKVSLDRATKKPNRDFNDDICPAHGCLAAPMTVRKAADAMAITAEYFAHAEDAILDTLCLLMNKLFQSEEVTESMKTGLVTPDFKKKGSNMDSKNYRGITF